MATIVLLSGLMGYRREAGEEKKWPSSVKISSGHDFDAPHLAVSLALSSHSLMTEQRHMNDAAILSIHWIKDERNPGNFDSIRRLLRHQFQLVPPRIAVAVRVKINLCAFGYGIGKGAARDILQR